MSAVTYEARVRVERHPDGTTRPAWHAKVEVWIANRRDTARTALGTAKSEEVAIRRALADAMAKLRAPTRKPGL